MFTFYGLCENLWGGSPAVTSLPNAIVSLLQDQLSSTTFVNKFPHDLSPVQPASFEEEEEEFEESVETIYLFTLYFMLTFTIKNIKHSDL